LQEAVYDHCREQHLEPPSPQRIERIIHSALRTADDRFYTDIMTQLSATTRARLDALLRTTRADQENRSVTPACCQVASSPSASWLKGPVTRVRMIRLASTQTKEFIVSFGTHLLDDIVYVDELAGAVGQDGLAQRAQIGDEYVVGVLAGRDGDGYLLGLQEFIVGQLLADGGQAGDQGLQLPQIDHAIPSSRG
jgi:hypothetical protein